MQKITKKSKLILYACSGLGINMLNMIVGSYLCSALLVGGFDKNVEQWTYLNKDLVIAAVWAFLVVVAKVVDGLIDIPLSHFTDNLRSRFGKRKTGILIGIVPTLLSYLLFLVPINTEATLLNTIWFALLLLIFYGSYTLTMLTYYATFSEIAEDDKSLLLLSNTKSICDVVYFSLSFALVPAFVSMGLNIRIVALLFIPLSLTMLIPMFLLKEKPAGNASEEAPVPTKARTSFKDCLGFTLKDKPFVFWMCIVFVMNMGLQLFLSGINEYFSTMNLDMTFIMASCFVPVPFTIMLYNKVVKRFGLGVGYRYVLAVFSLGMALMALCPLVPEGFVFIYAIICAIIVSFSIGAFFSITYTVPSQRAAVRNGESANAPSMYFAIQGLFEGASAGIASGFILVFLKQSGLVSYMTIIVTCLCMIAFGLTFLLPKTITNIGKGENYSKE